MIRLTDINNAISDATFTGFQLIVTHGLCQKTCLGWRLTEHVLANSCHSQSTSHIWSKGACYRLDSVVAGVHGHLLEAPPTCDSTNVQVPSHSSLGVCTTEAVCAHVTVSDLFTHLTHQQQKPILKKLFFSHAYNLLHLWVTKALVCTRIPWRAYSADCWPPPQSSPLGLEWGISDKFPGDAGASGPGTTPWETLLFVPTSWVQLVNTQCTLFVKWMSTFGADEWIILWLLDIQPPG